MNAEEVVPAELAAWDHLDVDEAMKYFAQALSMTSALPIRGSQVTTRSARRSTHTSSAQPSVTSRSFTSQLTEMSC